MATVTISSLQCEGTYSITAGGIVDQTLDGPRFHIETITAAECVMIPTATSSCKGAVVTYGFLDNYMFPYCACFLHI